MWCGSVLRSIRNVAILVGICVILVIGLSALWTSLPFESIQLRIRDSVAQWYWSARGLTSADGTITCQVGRDGRVLEIRNVQSGLAKARLDLGGAGWTRKFSLSPDGSKVAFQRMNQQRSTAVVFSICDSKEQVLDDAYDGISDIAFSPDSRFVAIRSVRKRFTVYSSTTGKKVVSVDGIAHCFGFSPKGNRLAACISGQLPDTNDIGSFVLLWEIGERGPMRVLNELASALVFSSDGETLVTVQQETDGTPAHIKVWDVSGGKEKRYICLEQGSFSYVSSADIGLDNTLVALEVTRWNGPVSLPGNRAFVRISTHVSVIDLSSGRTLAVLPDVRRPKFAGDCKGLATDSAPGLGPSAEPEIGRIELWRMPPHRRLSFVVCFGVFAFVLTAGFVWGVVHVVRKDAKAE